jgi:predicted HTH transcriptional regulator
LTDLLSALRQREAQLTAELEWVRQAIASHPQAESEEVPRARTRSSQPSGSRGRRGVRNAATGSANRAPVTRATRGGHTTERIIEFLREHPNSTAQDVAQALNGNRNSMSTRLSTLKRSGQIQKAERGYSAG